MLSPHLSSISRLLQSGLRLSGSLRSRKPFSPPGGAVSAGQVRGGVCWTGSSFTFPSWPSHFTQPAQVKMLLHQEL
ncbi:50S ribosomal protein L4, partial [Clarias magur]